MTNGVRNVRCRVELHTPDVGTAQERVQQETEDTTTKLLLRAYKVEYTSNCHNEADEAEVVCTVDDAGIDPRFLRNAILMIYLDDVGYADDIQPDIGNGDLKSGNLRFLGVVITVERNLTLEGGEKCVRIKAQDYTSFFLAHKSGFSPKYLPSYSDTLASAWKQICAGTGYLTFDTSPPSIVSTVSQLADNILFEPSSLATLTLGSAVSPRVAASSAKVECPRSEGVDSWAVWQHIVSSLGLITFIRGSRCVVTTATDYYSGDDPARMVWGLNITELSEARDQLAMSGKNIGIFSFNPVTGTHLESFYPPKGDITPKGRGKKKLGANPLGPDITLRAQDYIVFQCPMPCSDQKTLDDFTQRVWEEMSRQELKGRLKTPLAYTWSNSQFTGQGTGIPLDDPAIALIGLQSGDRIRVEIDQQTFTIIQALPSLQARIEAMMSRGYSQDLAQYVAKNLSAIASVSPEFQVTKVHTVWEVSEDGGEFHVEVDFINRIEVSGSAKPGVGESIPAIAGNPL